MQSREEEQPEQQTAALKQPRAPVPADRKPCLMSFQISAPATRVEWVQGSVE